MIFSQIPKSSTIIHDKCHWKRHRKRLAFTKLNGDFLCQWSCKWLTQFVKILSTFFNLTCIEQADSYWSHQYTDFRHRYMLDILTLNVKCLWRIVNCISLFVDLEKFSCLTNTMRWSVTAKWRKILCCASCNLYLLKIITASSNLSNVIYQSPLVIW